MTSLFLLTVLTLPQPAHAPGFEPLFNGHDLSGWYGWNIHAAGSAPADVAKLSAEERAKKVAAWTADAKKHWRVENGELINDGHGAYLATEREFRDYELLIEYRTVPKADSGIYLKGTPQVQIWDSTEQAKFNIGANKGSGGLWNNDAGARGKDPLVLADRPFGTWNSFRILQIGSRTTVWLNGQLVVDDAVMRNFWNPKAPLYAKGPILLQTHGGEIRWRNILIREIPPAEATAWLRRQSNHQWMRDASHTALATPAFPPQYQVVEEYVPRRLLGRLLPARRVRYLVAVEPPLAQAAGFVSLFNGVDLQGWTGATNNYEVVDGAIVCKQGKGGNLITREEYGDFVVRLEFKLPPGGNNGLALRYPGQGDPAYAGMCELQVLDDSAAKYNRLDARQYHGSAYGMAAAHRGYHRPLGEWNYQEVTVKGSTIKVELNGTVILDTDLAKVTNYMANSPHPGKDRPRGHFGFAGHNDPVMFRNIEIKKLN